MKRYKIMLFTGEAVLLLSCLTACILNVMKVRVPDFVVFAYALIVLASGVVAAVGGVKLASLKGAEKAVSSKTAGKDKGAGK